MLAMKSQLWQKKISNQTRFLGRRALRRRENALPVIPCCGAQQRFVRDSKIAANAKGTSNMLENEKGVVYEDGQARSRPLDEEIELDIGEGETQADGVRIEELEFGDADRFSRTKMNQVRRSEVVQLTAWTSTLPVRPQKRHGFGTANAHQDTRTMGTGIGPEHDTLEEANLGSRWSSFGEALRFESHQNVGSF